LEIPDNQYHSQFEDLAAYNIILENLSRENVYEQMQMLKNSDPEFDHILFAYFIDDLKQTFDALQDIKKDYPSWSAPLEDGKFKGISMLDALSMTTEEDIIAFLNFIISYPGKYIGQKWKFNEIYATWVINFTPLGEDDQGYLDKLWNYQDGKLSEFVKNNDYYFWMTNFFTAEPFSPVTLR